VAPVTGIERTSEARHPHPLFVRSQCSAWPSRGRSGDHRNCEQSSKARRLASQRLCSFARFARRNRRGSAGEKPGQGEQRQGMTGSGGGRRRVVEARRIGVTPSLATTHHQFRHRTQHSISKAQRLQGSAHGVDGSVNHVPRRRPRYAGRLRLPKLCSLPSLASASARRPLWHCASRCYYPPCRDHGRAITSATTSASIPPSEACERTKPSSPRVRRPRC
jgi:hypothetical protein